MLIHPSHRAGLQRVSATILSLLLGLVVVWLLPPIAQMRGLAGYVPLHTMLETVAVAIAMLIFAVGWNARIHHSPGNFTLLACAFAGVAVLDFSHALSFQGMPDFVTPSSPEKAINFWLAARALAAAALLAVTLLPWHSLASDRVRFLILLGVLLLVALCHWLFLFEPDLVPRTFIPGRGLTGFKVAAEYVIIGVNVITALLLLAKMRRQQPFNVAALFGAVCAMALSEYFFTLYASVADLFNLMGHFYKVVSYLFLYRALFVETIEAPYQQLEEAQAQLKGMMDAVPDLIWFKGPDHVFLSCNPQFERLFNMKEADIIGKNDYDFFDAETADKFRAGDFQAFERGQPVVSEEWLTFADNGYRGLFETIKTPVFDKQGLFKGVLGIARDITPRKMAEDEIRRLAFYDPLTGLPNRRLLLDRLHIALSDSARSNNHGALLFIDLDNFKEINDTRGHELGDQLLQLVARRLSTCVRESDSVARLGGDEFLIMLQDLGHDTPDAALRAEEVGKKVLVTLREPYLLEGKEHQSTPSIGITLFQGQERSCDQLIQRADVAMYQAKASGRNTVCFFDPAMQAAIAARSALEAELRQALARGEFLLHYQPQIGPGNRVIGAEALLRWRHPERGMVSPGEFIPLAEQTGIILPLGHWVLQTACAQLVAWAADPSMAKLTLSVNVSERQFQQDSFVHDVQSVLRQTGADPTRLKLELTESLLVSNIEIIAKKMNTLKALGVSFSLDDFGTGYSSLSYLKRLSLDQLKIDQSFVRDVLTDPNDAAIAVTVVALARSLGLDVIAEGVETEGQREFLERNGCHAFQGYLFSRPVPSVELEAFVQARHLASIA
jgi:diguanylate cyclase (GGDEF)-like protein/PAS domain S-box-containing protein